MYQTKTEQNRAALAKICEPISSLGTFSGVEVNTKATAPYKATWKSRLIIGLSIIDIDKIKEQAESIGLRANTIFATVNPDNNIQLEISFFEKNITYNFC